MHEESREFLVAVLNSRPGLLMRYEKWFPGHIPKDEEEYDFLLSVYRRLAPLWIHPKVRLSDAPKDAIGLYMLLLRHKLRVVWERALGHQNPVAAVRRLWAETSEIEHAYASIRRRRGMDVLLRGRVLPSRTESHEEFVLRFHRMERAMQWLQDTTHKLMRCKNPDCIGNPYCIRERPHQKY
jgi:hypothetical protein